MRTTKPVQPGDVQPGDMADHKSRTLDPRPVARVVGRDLYILIGDMEVGPVDLHAYTFIRTTEEN